LGRTQAGNNNGFCQDNEITWIAWKSADEQLKAFTSQVSALRAQHPVFRRRRFFDGLPVRRRGTEGVPDISWFTPDGSEMTDADWGSGFGKSVAMFLNGRGISGMDARGERILDDSFILFFNAHFEEIEFTLPGSAYGASWVAVLDTSEAGPSEGEPVTAAGVMSVAGRSLVVLTCVN
jgi:glycogen operon protein